MNFKGWISQVTTIGGLCIGAGDLLHAIGQQYLSGHVDVPTTIGLAAAALVGVAVNDNTALVTDVRAAASDYTRMAIKHTVDTTVAVADAIAVLKDLEAHTAHAAAAPVPPAPDGASGGIVTKVAGTVACLGVLLAAGLALSACSAQQAAQIKKVNEAVCRVDGVAQPIAVTLATPVSVAVAPASAPTVAGLVQLDQTAIHPAIQAACAAINGTPAGAIVAPVTAPASGAGAAAPSAPSAVPITTVPATVPATAPVASTAPASAAPAK